MQSKAQLLGHPVHQMLIVFPLGLLATGVVFDIIYLASGTRGFADVAYWLIFSGIIGGLLAAPFGLVDWLSIPNGTRAKRIGAMHGLGNAVVLVLFVLSEIMRNRDPADAPTIAYICSFAGAALALVTGWLGGELVDRLGIGVHANAGVDAPSSLNRHASQTRSPRAA